MAQRNWHEDVFYGIHYDLHANEKDTELGVEFTTEHLRERLSRVSPDWVQCDCKGHGGWTSWPTKVGSTSPGMVVDQVAIYSAVCRDLGIKLGMHYSGVWDSRAVALHPDWARVDAEGKVSDRITCALGPYDDELMIPQMIELIDNYDVDGFWVDGENWAATTCWCHRCTAEFTKRTGLTAVPKTAEDEHWTAWLDFHRQLFIEHVTKYTEAVHARKADCLICSNWMYTIRQPEPVAAPVDYLSGDFTPQYGADRAALEGRMLDSRGITWDLMAWGFTRQGDLPCQFKTALHLQQEVAQCVALGGAVMIYGKPQRSGWLVDWHQDILTAVGDFCRERQEVCFQTKSASEAGVLHLASHYYTVNSPLFNYGSAVDPVEGAMHALLETQRSADILPEDTALARLDQYKLLVVPEQTNLTEALLSALKQWVEAGGKLLLSGAHLASDYGELVGVKPVEAEWPAKAGRWGTVNLATGDEAVCLNGEWAMVEPLAGTEVLSRLMLNQEPSKDTTDWPAVTCRQLGQGAIVAIHGPIYREYVKAHYPGLRRLLSDLVDQLGIDWTVTTTGPSWLELVTRQRDDGRQVINLLNRGAGEMLGPRRLILEELPAIGEVTVTMQLASEPQSVTMAPDDVPLEWSWDNGVLTIHVAAVPIHQAIEIA